MSEENNQRLRALYLRLEGLLPQVQATKPEDADKPGRPGSGLGPLVKGYNTLLARVRELTADDPLVVELLQDLQPVNEVGSHLRAYYHVDAKHTLMFGINALLQVLAPRLVTATGVPSTVSVEREGLFVAGQRFDALLAATRILTTAQQSVTLVDGYIDAKVLELMRMKPENTTVHILAKAAALPGNIRALATAFNQQYGQKAPISIRTSDAFHDRFLVIDDTRFYHFGASLKDLGARGFMMSLIEEAPIVGLLRANIAAEWAKATLVV
jgi:hypothetical protein